LSNERQKTKSFGAFRWIGIATGIAIAMALRLVFVFAQGSPASKSQTILLICTVLPIFLLTMIWLFLSCGIGASRARLLGRAYPQATVVNARANSSARRFIAEGRNESRAYPRVPFFGFTLVASSEGLAFWSGGSRPALAKHLAWSDVVSVDRSSSDGGWAASHELRIRVRDLPDRVAFPFASSNGLGLNLMRGQAVSRVAEQIWSRNPAVSA
jgi:hypothetical protein